MVLSSIPWLEKGRVKLAYRRHFGISPWEFPGTFSASSSWMAIVVPFFGLTNSMLGILKGNPKKELQWRL